jgi:8-oxo-dGTP pyrophosphatase MutT (NUDIX family)
MLRPFLKHHSEVVLKTPIFNLRRERSAHPATGQVGEYVVLEQPDWVNVVAETAAGALVMVRQWRHGSERVELEIPAGLIEPGEAPLEAARRELREETGYEASAWEALGSMRPNPAFQGNTCHVMWARGCARVGAQALDPGEAIEVCELEAQEVAARVASGDIGHGIVLFALYRWLERRGQVRW